MLVLNLPFKALMFLTLVRPSLVLFLVLWLKLVKDFLKVRCRLALLPFLISCLIWLDLVASLPLIKERILVIIFLLHFLSLMLGSVDVDGTDQTSLGQFSGRVQQTYKHSVPRFFVPEHGTMFTLALVRFPLTATK